MTSAVSGVATVPDFNIKKSVQVAAVILKAQVGRRMSLYHLLKLLYIADRESLSETRFPIIGDAACAMDEGPLHSTVYDFIKGLAGGPVQADDWKEHIRREGDSLVLVSDPGEDELCPYEVRKLREICAKPVGRSAHIARTESHEYEEYVRHYVPGTSRPIPLKDILVAVGRKAEADRLARTIKGYAAAERHLRGAKK